jgi:hypothetical protein
MQNGARLASSLYGRGMESERHRTVTACVLISTAACLVALSVIGSAAAVASKGRHTGHRISAASVIVVPSTGQCVSGHRLAFQLRKVAHVRWVTATVKINGKRVRTITRAHGAKVVTLTRLPARTFVLAIRITTSDRRSATLTRTYKGCVAPTPIVPPKPVPRPIPLPKPAPTPAPLPPDGGAPLTLMPGSFSGATSQGYGLSFFVQAGGTHLVDVVLPTVKLDCTPGGTPYDHLQIADIAIAPDGSFTATTTQDGIFANSTAKFTYTFSGRLQGTTLSGAFREDLTYDDGTSYHCTSNDATWNATRSAQGSQAAPPVAPGSYSGATLQGYGLSFFVPAGGTHLVDVVLPTVRLGCTPGATPYDHLQIADIAIAPDGSFTATTTQDGIFANSAAHFTYTFSGHFHGTTTDGVPLLGGQFREDITYNNGTAYSCTSDSQTWSVTRDSQGSQAAPPVAPGSYSGATLQGYGLSFTVSGDSTQIQSVNLPTVRLDCTPGGTPYDHLQIADIAIASDGSFTATTTQDGIFASSAAHFTYTFSGHFHGTTTDGAARLAGRFREDITYNNGTAYSCTSDDQTWSVTHA